MVTVESCTGGGIAQYCTSISGSSTWFQGGWITYSNEMKIRLGVSPAIIEQFGAVSSQVAASMAEQGIKNSTAHWAVAVTGVAGPSGGSPAKPVGTVWFGVAAKSRVFTFQRRFLGDRDAIRTQTQDYALELLATYLR
jgi:nicotinamide-nucleotide amidase